MPTEPDPSVLPRQRWRLVVARSVEVADATQREVADGWEAALLGSGLPIARGDAGRGRPRIAFAAALPSGVVAAAERIDVVLTQRWPVWRVREAITAVVPDGWRLVDLDDVWLGAPALPGQVVAADYRITLGMFSTTVPGGASQIARACEGLLAADRLERDRAKGGSVVRYDLRRLVIDLAVAEPGPPVVLRARTRIHPELGTGRPEEVVAAIADSIGAELSISSIERKGLILADE